MHGCKPPVECKEDGCTYTRELSAWGSQPGCVCMAVCRYLLEYEEAAEEYRAEYRALLVRQNPELDQLLPSLDGCHGDGDEGAAPGGENI